MSCKNTGGIGEINFGRVTFCEEIKKQYEDNTVDLTKDKVESSVNHSVTFTVNDKESKKEIKDWCKEIVESIQVVKKQKEDKQLSVEQRLEKFYEEKSKRVREQYNKILYV